MWTCFINCKLLSTLENPPLLDMHRLIFIKTIGSSVGRISLSPPLPSALGCCSHGLPSVLLRSVHFCHLGLHHVNYKSWPFQI